MAPMTQRTLGCSGAIVSDYALGTMTFGAESDEATSHAMLDAFADEPVRGIGAGGYATYWNQHGSLGTDQFACSGRHDPVADRAAGAERRRDDQG